MASTAVIPPLNNNKRSANLPNSTTQITKKQKKALATAEKKEVNLKRIKEASKDLLSYDASNLTLTTPPEIKPCIKATDDVLTVGSYVEVIEDYSKGFNRPSGCGYVLRVTDKVIDVKYTAAHDSGRRHTNIPLTKARSRRWSR